jgi:hypothetical protein
MKVTSMLGRSIRPLRFAALVVMVSVGATSCAIVGSAGTQPSLSGPSGSQALRECNGAAGNLRLWPGVPQDLDRTRDLRVAIQYFLPGSPRRVKLMLLGQSPPPTPAPAGTDGYDVGIGDRFVWGGTTVEVRDLCGDEVALWVTRPSASSAS